MSNKKLLPCPFCGGEAKLMFIDYEDLIPKVWDESIEADSLYFHCYGCDSEFNHSEPNPTPEKMIEWFNTRKPLERIVERLEEDIADNPEASLGNYRAGLYKAIDIVKEEGGLNGQM